MVKFSARGVEVLAWVLMMVVADGCSTAPREPDGTADQSQASSGDVPGFYFTQRVSSFALGAFMSDTQGQGFDRVRGTLGVFATYLATGGTMAVSNATSPYENAPAYTMSGAAHNQAVMNYYLGRGLPPDQVIGVGLLTDGRIEQVQAQHGVPGTTRAFASVLQRGVEGVPVTDSIASAIEVADGTMTSYEQVWWPAFPHSVVDDAHALQAMVSDPVQLVAYQALLPTGALPGAVVIRHSGWHDVPFVVFASYDVMDGASLRHFAQDGTELHLPSEVVPLPAESAPQW